MQNVELFAQKFDGFGDELVGLVVAVDPQDAGHDEEVPVVAEDVLELVRGVDDRRHAISQNASVLGMQSQGSVDYVDEQLDIGSVRKVSCHGFEHSGNQSNPIKFVQHIQTQ